MEDSKNLFLEANVSNEKTSNNVEWKSIFRFLKSKWYLLLISTVFCFFAAKLYLKYLTPIYRVKAKVLIKDVGNGKDGGNMDVLKDIGLISSKSSIDNELEILKSVTLMDELVKAMNLNIRYYIKTKFKPTEIYNEQCPFKVIFPNFNNDSMLNPVSYNIRIIDNNGYEIKIGKKDKKMIGKWGESIILPIGKAIFYRNFEVKVMKEQDYLLSVTNYQDAVDQYMQVFEPTLTNKQASAITFSLKEAIPEKGVDILNKIIHIYIQDNIDDKNEIADSTMAFITDRLASLGNDLSSLENDIEKYKIDNKIVDVEAQGKALVGEHSEINKNLSEKEVQIYIVKSIITFMNEHSTSIVPSTLLQENEIYTKLIEKYNELQATKIRLLMSQTSSSPIIQDADRQIKSLKDEIITALSAIESEMQIEINNIKKDLGIVYGEISKVPSKQRIFLEYTRQQNILQELYLFLLKTKEQSAITKSSNIANIKIIDSARCERFPVSPNKKIFIYGSLFIGLIIPLAWFYIRGMLNTTVQSKFDISNNTSVPVIGEIGHNIDNSSVVIQVGSKSLLAEQFRSLRTNIQFFLNMEQEKVIMLTSSMSEEGKSFISTNLGCSLAISGKKVIILELDLRKPKISKTLGLDNSIGFSNYAIGQAELSQIIQPSGVLDSLFIIPSGPVPPNPAELILLNKTEELFKILRTKFDYIIIDTPPIGFVTDAQLANKYADLALYVVRNMFTEKEQLKIVDNLYTQKKINKIGIVINDIKMDNGSSYGYEYGYGYGYGYKKNNTYYIEEVTNNKFISFLKKNKKK